MHAMVLDNSNLHSERFSVKRHIFILPAIKFSENAIPP